ncbi:MAG: bifunctional GNAT family N-acetyltransferase/carbon-nitrogen hydrolase family protein [Catalinimonas sp.]
MEDINQYSVTLRPLRKEDYSDLKGAMIEAYAGIGGTYWREEKVFKLLELFPEGQICVELNGQVVACALAIVVDYKKFGDDHTYEDITGKYTFSTHDPLGDVLYGIDIFVHPGHRGFRLGRRLYGARKDLCERLNLRAIIAGGRIPNYERYADDLSPREYIEKVRMKEIFDPTLTFQLSNDFHVRKVLRNYLRGDTQSHEFAALLEWNNIYHRAPGAGYATQSKSVARVGVVQWQMRPMQELDAFLQQAEFFVDTISDYKADFVLFPELFNAPLMTRFNHQPGPQAVRSLAGYTEEIRQRMLEWAVSYNVNIIAGSFPVLEEGVLRNVAYLLRRNGTWEAQHKLHVTPSEERAWGMSGGSDLQVFETDTGKIGILICYDVEFPELPRLLAQQGMQMLFVPFMTSTQNGYNRVRLCARARAIENECYVSIAGCVGNLPKVKSMDIQFAQAAVFTPADFPFPSNAIKAEATPNTEMTLIVDLDLGHLKELHNYGSVRNLKDRRTDLYRLDWTAEREGTRPPVQLNGKIQPAPADAEPNPPAGALPEVKGG